ncbi:Scm-like with four MBT domains protein 2 [Larimichthys crocea]|uniref:Uncharacterized protein n=1 Tax=Larimichthys crocea TaxID=215358 RepID=A0ACD3RK84_LARCR|nr:Scm-like with four MBT domains protein 2 [Larimichthys crocea]
MSQESPESDGDSTSLDFNWDDYLEETGAVSVPHHAFKHVDQGLQTGLTPGMKLEVCVRSEADSPYWVANIITTCGQLLLLRYEGYQDDRRADFWCDIMTADLHPLGWSRQHGKTMRAPEGVREKHQEWEALLEKALAEECSAPANLLELPQRGRDPVELLCAGCYVELQDSVDLGLAWAAEVEENVGGRLKLRLDQPAIAAHCFKEGMKLEAVDPAAPISIRPATVTKVFNEQYFLVTMDDLCGIEESEGAGRSYLCHRDSPGIFPAQWSLKNGLPLSPPPGYQGPDFDWADYLKQCEAEAAPQHCFPTEQCDHSFKEAMKLEAVNPLSPENIHVATVTRVKGQYIWLSLEVEKERKIAVVQPEKHRTPPKSSSPDTVKQQMASQSETGQGNGKYCCPKIYFNHRCFSGPYLNKGTHCRAASVHWPWKLCPCAQRGIDSADKLSVQAQSGAERAAAGPGEPLARPWRDTQSQVQGKELPGHCGNRPYCRPCSRLLQENLHQARVLPKPVWTPHGSGALL